MSHGETTHRRGFVRALALGAVAAPAVAADPVGDWRVDRAGRGTPETPAPKWRRPLPGVPSLSLIAELDRMKHFPTRPLRLNDLVATSDRSQLIGYSFESKELRLQIFHPTAGLVHFQIPTDTVHGRTVPTDPRRSACRIDLIDLGKTLAVVEGRYSPPTNLDRFLQHAQTRTTLAYGRRASEYRWLLLVRGGYPLLACLVGDLSEIEWTTE